VIGSRKHCGAAFWAMAVGGEKARSGSEIWIDFTDYSLPPIDNILGILAWMSKQQ
jgi:hypothetical protein